ncbi:hypothetical protein ACSBR1_042896 [Camellia fascicularis]
MWYLFGLQFQVVSLFVVWKTLNVQDAWLDEAELIEPALNGTLNVLGSCAKDPTVKQVVLTSSIAAVAYNGRPRTSDVIIDETWFSDLESCKESCEEH